MHIPDGIMAPPILALGWAATLVVAGLALQRLRVHMPEEYTPTLALLAAGLFVAQMLNFPILGGTTGHLLGAALVTILLGPAAGIVVLTVILLIQALLFSDGGILALGLNIANMALAGSLCASGAYRSLRRWNASLAAFAAAWASVVVPALLVAAELGASYALSHGGFGIPAVVAFPAMGLYHTLIGVGEGAITVGVLAYFDRAAPELRSLKKVGLFGVSA